MTAPTNTHFRVQSSEPALGNGEHSADRVTQALEEYSSSVEAGHPLSRESLLSKYSDVADELEGCLDSLAFIRQVAPQLADEPSYGAAAGGSAFAAANLPSSASGMGSSPDPAHPTSNIKHPTSATLGDFRIVREIGRGGMGVVYEAEQLSLGRRVALKVLPFAAMLESRRLERFRHEAQAAAMLRHPHIVTVYSVGCERGVHYYAMDYIEGPSLAEVVAAGDCPNLSESARKNGTVPLSQAADTAPIAALSTLLTPHSQLPAFASREFFRTIARLGIQAAEALDYAHQMGVVHRDIKPSNLLLECTHLAPRDETAKESHHVEDRPWRTERDGYTAKLWITDFGLAMTQSDAGLTMTGDLLGTLRYMSPEQAAGKRLPLDHRTDVYSLGATLYELLAGRPAFDSTDRAELLRAIAEVDPQPLRRLVPAISVDLETIVRKAMEKDAANRYDSARDLAGDLCSFLEGRTIKAKPPTRRDRIVKWSRSHPSGVRATLLALLATAGVVAASVGWTVRDQAARQALLEEQVALALDEADNWYRAGKLTEAMSAVKRADGFLASGQGNNEIKRTIDQWKTDLGSATRLEEIRLDRGAQPSGSGDTSFVDRAYLEVFRQQGVDLPSLTIEESARRIRNSRMKDELVAALHDWRQTGSGDVNGESASRENLSGSHLLQIARVADPDPWRNRLRDAVERGDETALLNLAGEEEIHDQPSATITLLTQALTARKKHLPVAIDLLKQVQSQRPNDFWINIALANSLRTVHPQRTEEAIAFRRVAVALRPDSAFALSHLGVALDSTGQYAEALTAFQRAIRLNPKDIITRGNLVGMYVQRGKQADAEALLAEMRRLKPGDSREYEALARAHSALGKFSEAEAAIREAIRREPIYFQAHRLLSGLLADQGKLADAEAAAREAVRIRPDVLMSRCVLVELVDMQGKRAEAEAELAEAMSIEPSGHVEYYALALVLARLDKVDEAERALREAIRQAPDFVPGHQQLSAVLLRQKKHADAAATLRDAVRNAPENVEMLNSLSWLLATSLDDDIRDGKEAVKLATSACELTAYKVVGVVDTLAAAHAEAGDFDAAIEWCTKAIELANADAIRDELTKHLESFRSRKPWRE